MIKLNISNTSTSMLCVCVDDIVGDMSLRVWYLRPARGYYFRTHNSRVYAGPTESIPNTHPVHNIYDRIPVLPVSSDTEGQREETVSERSTLRQEHRALLCIGLKPACMSSSFHGVSVSFSFSFSNRKVQVRAPRAREP